MTLEAEVRVALAALKCDGNLNPNLGNSRKGYVMEVLVVLLLLFLLYILPTIVAWRRKHPSENAIAIVNIFLGWTFIGWVVALAWAFTAIETPKK
jgi:hypothetical protein